MRALATPVTLRQGWQSGSNIHAGMVTFLTKLHMSRFFMGGTAAPTHMLCVEQKGHPSALHIRGVYMPCQSRKIARTP